MTAPTTSLPFVPGRVVPSRYQNNVQLLRTDGVQVQMARRPINTQVRTDDLYHVWADGEYLDLLADTFYGDASLWWVIADFNGITEYRVITVGQRLRFPTVQRLLLEILST